MRRFTAVLRFRSRKITTANREADDRVRYGGPWVSAASKLPLRRPLTRFMGAAVRRPRRFVALIALLLRTPREYVALSGSSAGQALNAYFNQRSVGGVPKKRFCQGVLLLPQEHADYLRGRRRQALRTNLRKAEAAGIHCETISDPWRVHDDLYQVLRRQWTSWTDAQLLAVLSDVQSAFARSEVTVAVARDKHGRALAVVAAVIDDMVCLIKHAVATSHEARWALHDHLVRILIARRVRYLLADGGGLFGALGFSTNVQHYQHLLGYELRHVMPAGRRHGMRRRRLLTSLVLVTATAAVAVPRAAAIPVHRTTPHHVVWTTDRSDKLR